MVILEDEKFTLSTFPVTHRGPDCFGFLFQEKARRPFLADVADQIGVPFGPERARLVRGEPITLADGTVVRPDDVLGAEIPGTKYVHIGDAGRTDDVLEVCRNADALTIESTYTEEEAEMAHRFGHLQGIGIGRQLDGQLLLDPVQGLVRRAIFPNTHVARDLDHYRVTRDGAALLKDSD